MFGISHVLLLILVYICLIGHTNANVTPIVTSVTVTYGDFARVNKNYLCEYTIYDPDVGDTHVVTYAWYANGFSLYLNARKIFLSSANLFEKGDVIYCEVYVTDAAGASSFTVASTHVTLVNTPPTMDSAPTLTPTPLKTADDVTCIPGTTTDIDDVAPFTYTYEWYINKVLLATETSNVLSSVYYTKNDLVECWSTPYDSTDGGTAANSTRIRVQNTPPVVDTVTLTPSPAVSSDILSCNLGTVTDDDGDVDFKYKYRWIINNDIVGTHHQRYDTVTNSTIVWFVEYNETTLPAGNTILNDNVFCSILAIDNTDVGIYTNSNIVNINNEPPIVTSIELSPLYPTSFDNILCNVTGVVDPNNIERIFLYNFKWYNNNILIRTVASSSLSYDILPYANFIKGDVIYCLGAADDGDLGFYVETSNVTIANSAPQCSDITISMNDNVSPTLLTCNIGVVFDPDPADNTILYTYAWYINNNLINGQTTNQLTSTHWSSNDTITCSVIVSDGIDAYSMIYATRSALMYAPTIVSFSISDPDNLDSIYDLDDVILIEFDLKTDRGLAQTGTAYSINIDVPKTVIDTLFIFSKSLGDSYIGRWLSGRIFQITILDARNNGGISIGGVSVSPGNNIFESADYLALVSDSTVSSPSLSGTFGTADSIFICGMIGTLSSYKSSDIIHISTTLNINNNNNLMTYIDGGNDHIVAIGNGLAYAIGSNQYKQLGLSSNITTTLTSTSANFAVNDIVAEWQQIDSLSNKYIVDISAGFDHTLALDDNGIVYSSGRNMEGQIGQNINTMTESSTFIQIHSNQILPQFSKIIAGGQFSILLCHLCTGSGLLDSAIYAFGLDFSSNYTVGQINSNPKMVLNLDGYTIIDITAGLHHVLILTSDGTLLGWGRNQEGQLGLSVDITSVEYPTVVQNSNFVSISAGDYHSLAIDNEGKVYCWGKNSDGQCGNSDIGRIYTPTLIDNSLFDYTTIRAIIGGPSHSIVINYNDDVYGFGYNVDNVLGLGLANTNLIMKPTLLDNLPSISLSATTNKFTVSIVIYDISSCYLGCSGHGICNSFSQCDCIGSWNGTGCEIPVCPVGDNNIQCNGIGVCTSGIIPYCNCPNGFTGTSCNLADCNDNLLNNCYMDGNNRSGIIYSNTHECILINNDYTIYHPITNVSSIYTLSPYCDCDIGYAQPDCVDCELGFTGNQCEILSCNHLNNCNNQGTCTYISATNDVICECDVGYFGTECGFLTSECPGNPICNNHGSCIAETINNNVISSCDCDTKWSGDECEIYECIGVVDACSGNGDCIISPGNDMGYCECFNNTLFTGSDCSQPICSASCSSNGQCIVGSNGDPACSCNDGWSGTDCTSVIKNTSDQILTWIITFVVVVVIAMICFFGCLLYSKAMKVSTDSRYFNPVKNTNKVANFMTIHHDPDQY